MKIAYADPPYYGCSVRLYGDQHEDAAVYDTQQGHLALVSRLADEYPDGWALSCNPADLRWLYPATPEGTRIATWCKTWHRIRPLVSVQWAWEPLLWYGGRNIKGRNPIIRDWLTCPVTLQRSTKGAKPEAFCHWMFALLGLVPGDDLHDLFPGSGAVSAAWEAWCRQGVLL